MKKKDEKMIVGNVLDIPLDKIIEPRAPIRNEIIDEDLESLAKSIAQLGLIQPITVKEHGNKYEIIAGHRRFLAHQRLKKVSIRAIVRRWPDEDDNLASLAENIARADVNAFDEALYLVRTMQERKLMQADLARKLGRSEGYVSGRLALLKAPAIIQDAIRDKQITLSVARELMQITDPDECARLCVYAIQNGASPAVARAWRLAWQASQETTNNDDGRGTTSSADAISQTSFSFKCEGCGNSFELAELRIMRVCPSCLSTIREQ